MTHPLKKLLIPVLALAAFVGVISVAPAQAITPITQTTCGSSSGGLGTAVCIDTTSSTTATAYVYDASSNRSTLGTVGLYCPPASAFYTTAAEWLDDGSVGSIPQTTCSNSATSVGLSDDAPPFAPTVSMIYTDSDVASGHADYSVLLAYADAAGYELVFAT